MNPIPEDRKQDTERTSENLPNYVDPEEATGGEPSQLSTDADEQSTSQTDVSVTYEDEREAG